MRYLKLGQHGDDVRALQNKLKVFVPEVEVDGRFGPRTERAVRIAQRRLGLFPPDGIAGPKTLGALFAQKSAKANATGQPSALTQMMGALKAAEEAILAWVKKQFAGPQVVPASIRPAVQPALRRAEYQPVQSGTVAPVAGMRMSAQGRLFIVRHETQPGVSNRLHHPSMGSGVTLGPGYDMKDRSRAQVANDLKSIFGVDPAAAERVAEGAGKSGHAARDFVRANKDAINLSDTQQAALLANIVGHYEAMVRRAIKIPLHQYEFDALVSYAYNPGGGWKRTTALINQHRPKDAAVELSKHVYSRGQRIKSLVVRRTAETQMLLYGEYH